MTDDECACARCQHPALDSSFGFRDATKAEDITRHMARGNHRPYWLVRSHMGIWYFVQVPHLAGRLPRKAAPGFEEIMARELQRDIIQWLSYLGCEVVKTFDALGDEVPK